jgi:hypothetical protein
MTSKKLTVLQEFSVPSPCHQDWEKMRGDKKSRFCDHCQHSVVNLSSLTKAQAAKLLEAQLGSARLCVRFEHTPSGEVIYRRPSTLWDKTRDVAGYIAVVFLGLFGFHAPAWAQTAQQPVEQAGRYSTRGEAVAVPTETSPTPQATPQFEMGLIAPESPRSTATPSLTGTPVPNVLKMGKVKAMPPPKASEDSSCE